MRGEVRHNEQGPRVERPNVWSMVSQVSTYGGEFQWEPMKRKICKEDQTIPETQWCSLTSTN